tara:strand:+ start:2450 stop:2965 length:516 start_codon:yes stop_codon:yes gene_type:complete
MNWITETKRLALREMNDRDAESAYLLNLDSEVYTGDVAFKSMEEAAGFLRDYDDYQRNGFGRWAVVSKENTRFLGWCGLKLHPEGFVDLGFRFFKKEWNKGYATEASMACLRYGFEELNLPEIIGRVAAPNVASIAVLKKVGMEYWKQAECKGIKNSEIYRISGTNFSPES